MERRKFLQTLSTAIASGCVSGAPALGGGNGGWTDNRWKVDFARALRKNPWLLGFKGTNENFPRVELPVKGTLPSALKGVFYRNGPAQHEIGNMRYHHFFDGDGMVHAFRFNANKVTHEGRFVETRKYLEEKKAGKAIEQGFGTALPSMLPPASADAINVANINIIKHNGELLALWEGGSAYRLDSETLETLGLKTWSEESQGLPFSAHPRIESDGTLWNFGYAPPANAMIIYRISPKGKLLDIGVHRMSHVPMVHDFMVTKNHLVFLLPPYVFDRERGGSFLDHFVWKPEQGGQALIVSKNDLSHKQFIDIPAFWCFHMSNAYEDGTKNIRFQVAHHDNIASLDGFSDIMRGNTDTFTQSNRTVFMAGKIDLERKSAHFEAIGGTSATEFPRIDPRRTGKRHRHNFMMQFSDEENALYFDKITHFDDASGRIKSFTYPDGSVADEHIYVPHPRSKREGKGWLLGTVLDVYQKKSALNVFDARRVDEGPIATMQMEYPVPLGLHGNFAES